MKVDGKSGKTVWKVDRPTGAIAQSPDADTTPLLVRTGKTAEIAVTGGDIVTGHDPETGKELWGANGPNPSNDLDYRIVASPIVAGDPIIAPTRNRPMLALKPGGPGDVTQSHKAAASISDRTFPRREATASRRRRPRQRRHPCPRSCRPAPWAGVRTVEDGSGQLVTRTRRWQALRHERERRHDIGVHCWAEVRSHGRDPLDDYRLASPAVSNGQIYIRTDSSSGPSARPDRHVTLSCAPVGFNRRARRDRRD